MHSLKQKFTFDIRGLWVSGEAFGEIIRLTRRDFDVEIAVSDGESLPILAATDGQLGKYYRTNELSVTVSGKVRCEAHLEAVAVEVLTEFLDWCRSCGQIHLGLHGELPTVRAIDIAEDTETGELYMPDGQIPGSGIGDPSFGSIEFAIDSREIQRIQQKLGCDERVELPEQFLADALYFEARDEIGRAVLMAAIACELKIKETLRAKVRPAAAELLDVLLDNPRDHSVQAAALFHKVLKACVGTSLHEHDKTRFNAIEELFKLRNRIAHHGKAPEDAKGRDVVLEAKKVFQWLDLIPAAGNESAS